MKIKVTFFSFLFLAVVLVLSSFISAAANITSCEQGDDNCRIDNAYTCLEDKIDTRTCAKLGSDEKAFALIATGDCKSEVISDSKYKSDIRYTSLALLGGATKNGTEEWLVSKNRTTDNLDWFLQIESSEESSCTVSTGNNNYNIKLNEDKTVTAIGSLGGCFSIPSGNNYWTKINQNCFDEEITVSCDKSFLTSLIYQKQGSGTIYISDETHQSSSGGKTTERVDSLCFGTSGCNYEGSLWAALVLNSLNYDVSPYMPYLVANMNSNNNPSFLPEAFVYLLTGEFGNDLLSKQISDKWWLGSSNNDKFYDTAVALYALQYDNSLQRQNSIKWLLNEVQGSDGCWSNGDVRDTAFLLYSIEPRTSSDQNPGDVGAADCESSGYNCMSEISCSQAGGEEVSSYSCAGISVCCDKQKVFDSCSEQGGEICSSGQTCAGGIDSESSDTTSGQICCVNGSCEVSSGDDDEISSSCVSADGACRQGSCLENEEELFGESCQFTSDLCCVEKGSSPTGTFSSVWIWVLLVLIILVVIGIIFRDRLKQIWFRTKSGFGGSKSSPSGRPPFTPPSQFSPGRVFSSPQRRPVTPQHSSARPRGELDDVLKKLKDMGK